MTKETLSKAEKYINDYEYDVSKMEGKKGVVQMRETLSKLKQMFNKYDSIFNPHTRNPQLWDYKNDQIMDKWLHRHGLRQSENMIYKKEKWAGYIQKYNELLAYPELKYRRGAYGEIIVNRFELPYYFKISSEMTAAEKCIKDIENQGFDEHGGWSQYAEFDKHGRGSAINVDIYGMDYENQLYVIQVRQFEKRYKNGYSNVRKSYFLIGYNENGNPFAHPVSSHMVHAAIKKDDSIEYVVHAAQAWIWGIDVNKLDDVLRNGDVAMVPVSKKFKKDAEPVEKGMFRIVDSHWCYTKKIYKNGAIYAYNPTIRHFKGQHPTVKGKGWYKIIVGNRADYHDFARPTID